MLELGHHTKLVGPAKWTYYYLYSIIDIYSHYTVGWMVATRESKELAERLLGETIAKQNIDRDQLTIHADRGSSMASKPVAFLLADLGVTKSHSRPHTSNDNPFSEAQFKTLKYRPDFPQTFGSLQDARAFCARFYRWYNHNHHHSGIGMHTPSDVHHGHAAVVRAARAATLSAAYAATPTGSSASTPNRRACPARPRSTDPNQQTQRINQKTDPTGLTGSVGECGWNRRRHSRCTEWRCAKPVAATWRVRCSSAPPRRSASSDNRSRRRLRRTLNGEAVDMLADGSLVVLTAEEAGLCGAPQNLGLLEAPAPPPELPHDILRRLENRP